MKHSRKKQARLKKAAEANSNHRLSQESLVTDASSLASSSTQASSRASSRPWIRDPMAEAKPISDPFLRKKLQGAKGSGPRVTPRDQKILERMLAKKEEEKNLHEQRESARLRWEAERQNEAVARNSAEIRRRRTLSEERLRKDSSRRHTVYECTRDFDQSLARRCNGNGNHAQDSGHRRYQGGRDRTHSCDSRQHEHGCGRPGCGRNHDKETQQHGLRKSEDDLVRRQREESVEQCKRSWIMASQKQLDLKKQQLQEKKMRELDRKHLVEKRLEDQRHEIEEYQAMLRMSQEQALQKAASMRMTKEQEQSFRTRWKNFHAQKRHEEKMNEVKNHSDEERQLRRNKLLTRQKSATSKLGEYQDRKDRELKRRSLDLDQKVNKCRETQRSMTDQLQSWHEDLLNYRQFQEKKAAEVARENAKKKAQRAHEDRLQKERLQRANLQKLTSQEEEWRADLEATIAMKDTRSKLLQREKEETIHESRSLAQVSQRLREELKQHYSMNDLDQLNRQASMEAKIVNKPVQTATKNMSTLNLG